MVRGQQFQGSHAVTLWEQHKDDLIGRIGQVVGTAFDALKGLLVPATVGGTIRLFDGLAQADKDLKTAGLQLAPLQYDQALAVADLVAKLSDDRKLVLIFDAWEASATIQAETALLDAFLRNQDKWPALHAFLAVRNPSLDEGDRPNQAFVAARKLCVYSTAFATQSCELKAGHSGQPMRIRWGVREAPLVTKVRTVARYARPLPNPPPEREGARGSKESEAKRGPAGEGEAEP